MIEQTAKVLLGTALYVAVVREAGRNPRAAGMMLTFPALNGISMLMTEAAELEQVVGTMLLLPIINGASCAVYLSLFDRIVRPTFPPATLSTLLLLAISSLWIVLAWEIARKPWSVPVHSQLVYVVMMALAGLLATLAFPMPRPGPRRASAPEPLMHLLNRNWSRILLFAIALASVLVADRLQQSPALLGVLAALPLVPFFSLHTIASDRDLSPAARREELARMANGVWLGPAIAMTFIVGFWWSLEKLATRANGTPYLLAGIITLLVGWGLCIVVIWACQKLLRRVLPETA